MGIKPPEILNRLPSASELLDKPPIRALTDRWNRSVVAGGIRSFLDELTNDLKRRTADVQVPSIRELAERAARYIISQQQQQLGTAINATGHIWGMPWTGRPLPDAALERALAVGREFVIGSSESADRHAKLAATLCHMAGSQAAVVVHSYAGALWLALATVAAKRDVLVARAEVGDIGRGEPLPSLIASANAQLREVGATNRAQVEDYQAAVSSSSSAVLVIDPDEYRVVGQTATAKLEQLVAFARERELAFIAAVGTAPLVDPPESLKWPRRSASATLAAGADLVVLRGDGLVGGPPCGILLGNSKRIDAISHHSLFNAWRLDEFRSAALAAAVECHQDVRGVESLPVWQLLTTPLENLRNRAERIAPQLAEAADVASAVAVETRSPISAPLSADGGLESYGVALTARSGSIAEFDHRLQTLPLPILGRVETDRLLLDLRTVMPRQDRAIVEAIVGSQVSQNP